MKEFFNPKLFSLLRSGIERTQITNDILAGIIVGIVALPLSIAFAVASGVSPERGLITAVVAGFLISFLGGSRVQIGGPTGAFVILIFGIVHQHGINFSNCIILDGKFQKDEKDPLPCCPPVPTFQCM